MRQYSINDLRLLFLELIAKRTPKAAAQLFNLRDADAWMDIYGVSADWLLSFVQAVLNDNQSHIGWIERQVRAGVSFRSASVIKVASPDDGPQAGAAVRPAATRHRDVVRDLFALLRLGLVPRSLRFFARSSGARQRNEVTYSDSKISGEAFFISAAAAAWLRTLGDYQVGHELLGAAANWRPDLVSYADPATKKQKPRRHCRWLVWWIFEELGDEDIAEMARVSDKSDVGNLRREFARVIGLDVKTRRHRRIKGDG